MFLKYLGTTLNLLLVVLGIAILFDGKMWLLGVFAIISGVIFLIQGRKAR